MIDIKGKLTDILSRVLGFQVDETVNSQSSYEWDSIAHLQIIMEVESEFDVKFPSREIPNLTSYKNLAEAIERHKLTTQP